MAYNQYFSGSTVVYYPGDASATSTVLCNRHRLLFSFVATVARYAYKRDLNINNSFANQSYAFVIDFVEHSTGNLDDT